MFGWRKKRDGFEWRQYVRTTIVLRREQRRARLDELRHAAAERAAEAGKIGAEAGAAGVEAAKAGLGKAGSGARLAAGKLGGFLQRRGGMAGAALRRAGGKGMVGARAGLGAAGRGALAAGRRGFGAMRSRIGASSGLGAGLARLTPPQIALPCFIAGLAALIGAGYRLLTTGADQTAIAAGLIAFVLMAAAGLAVTGAERGAESWVPTLRARGGTTAADVALGAEGAGRPVRWPLAAGLVLAASVLAFGLIGAWQPQGHGPADEPATATGSATTTASAPVAPPATRQAGGDRTSVRGFAVSLTGDSLRVGGTTVRLAGIAAPEPAQSCAGEGRASWQCGLSALNALRRITGRRTITCSIEGRDERGRQVAACSAGGKDIGAELVRGGHAFAETGLLSTRYRREEETARAARLGIWRGPAQRPQEFRDHVWEEARRARPDGCPIKGRASASGKVYVLPWVKGYARTDVRETRGDRWFCSEAEALEAGWRPQES